MQQTKILFSDDTAKYAPSGSSANGGKSVFQFEKPKVFFEIAVRENYRPKPVGQRETRKTHESFFVAPTDDRAARADLTINNISPSARCVRAKAEPKRLFDVLLVYLDRIVSFDEMFENLEKLESAVRTGNWRKINRIAYDCADLCRDCEMFSAIAPLLELERVERENQMARAAFLLCSVKRQFERRRVVFNTSLRRLAAATARVGGVPV